MNPTYARTVTSHLAFLRFQLATLLAERETCTTAAMRASVQGSIEATEWQIEQLTAQKPDGRYSYTAARAS